MNTVPKDWKQVCFALLYFELSIAQFSAIVFGSIAFIEYATQPDDLAVLVGIAFALPSAAIIGLFALIWAFVPIVIMILLVMYFKFFSVWIPFFLAIFWSLYFLSFEQKIIASGYYELKFAVIDNQSFFSLFLVHVVPATMSGLIYSKMFGSRKRRRSDG